MLVSARPDILPYLLNFSTLSLNPLRCTTPNNSCFEFFSGTASRKGFIEREQLALAADFQETIAERAGVDGLLVTARELICPVCGCLERLEHRVAPLALVSGDLREFVEDGCGPAAVIDSIDATSAAQALSLCFGIGL